MLFLIFWSCEDKYTTPTEVTLWGEVYSLEDMDTLKLNYNQLTDSIPTEIGLINSQLLIKITPYI